jgi:hypothetical protein
MFPILGLAAAAVSTLTAGQAALIGGSIGAAAAAFGTNALKQKSEAQNNGKDNGYEIGKEIIDEAINEALRIVRKRHNI